MFQLSRFLRCYLVFSSLTLSMVCVAMAKDTKELSNYKRVCYYTNWSQYRKDQAKFLPTDIDPFLCTHLIFAFAKIDKGVLAPYEWNDMQYPFLYKQFNALKEKNPNLKTLLAVGGWTHGSQPFTEMVTSKSTRDKFTQHAIDYLRNHGFDGLDLDWEYPANRGSPEVDKERFTLLVKELREAFDAESKKSGKNRLLLSAAVPGGERLTTSGYDVKTLNKYVDFFNLMSYDLHGSWSPLLGHHAPLIGGEKWVEAKGESTNVEQAVNLWLKQGADPEKLVMGLALYGKTFKLCNKGTDPGDKGCGSANPDTLNYYEILQKLKSGKYEKKWMGSELVPYAYSASDKLWVGFDDEESLRAKIQFAKKSKLAGVMVWAIDGDDFSGKFGDGRKYPLMNLIRTAIEGDKGHNIKYSVPEQVKEPQDKMKDKDKSKTKVENETKGANELNLETSAEKKDPKTNETDKLKNEPSAANHSEPAKTEPNGTKHGIPKPNSESTIVAYEVKDSIKEDTKISETDPVPVADVDQISVIGAPIAVENSEPKPELFQKPMAIPLQANLLSGREFKIPTDDVVTSKKPELKQRNVTIQNASALLRQRLKQNQMRSLPSGGLSASAALNRPAASKTNRPTPGPKTQDGAQRSRGQQKKATTVKVSSSVFSAPKETVYQKPISVKITQDANSGAQNEVSADDDAPGFTDNKSFHSNDIQHNFQDERVKRIRSKLKKRPSLLKSGSLINDLLLLSKTSGQLLRDKNDDDKQPEGNEKTSTSPFAPKKKSSFGKFVTLYPEEASGWKTSSPASTGAPEWVYKLMTDKTNKVEGYAISNDNSANVLSVDIQTLDKPRDDLPNPAISNQKRGEKDNSASGETSGGKLYVKSIRPATSVYSQRLRGKFPRRNYVRTAPYKSLSPFVSQKEKMSRNYERIPKISKYSIFDDEDLAILKESQIKSNIKYQMNLKSEQTLPGQSKEKMPGGEPRWWDVTSTQSTTVRLTAAPNENQQLMYNEKKTKNDVRLQEPYNDRMLLPESPATAATTMTREEIQKTTANSMSVETDIKDMPTKAPADGEDFVDLNSFLHNRDSTTQRYKTTKGKEEETTPVERKTSFRNVNPLTKSQYKQNKPWWSATSTASLPAESRPFKKRMPAFGRKYHGDLVNTIHKESVSLVESHSEKGNVDMRGLARDMTVQSNAVNGERRPDYDNNIKEEPSGFKSFKKEVEEDAFEGSIGVTMTTTTLETTSEVNTRNMTNYTKMRKSGFPDSQTYHSKLSLQTLKHDAIPEKIYHYRHIPGSSDNGHAHQRVNKLAENEVAHVEASLPPPVNAYTPDMKDWNRIKNLLRNSTVVAEIKSKLDEIHRSVTSDLTTKAFTGSPKLSETDAKEVQKSTQKWYDQENTASRDGPPLLPSSDISASSSVAMSQPLNTRDKTISRVQTEKNSRSWNSKNSPGYPVDRRNAGKVSDITVEKYNAKKRENPELSFTQKTPKYFQNDVIKTKTDNLEGALEMNGKSLWWAKDKNTEENPLESNSIKDDLNIINSKKAIPEVNQVKQTSKENTDVPAARKSKNSSTSMAHVDTIGNPRAESSRGNERVVESTPKVSKNAAAPWQYPVAKSSTKTASVMTGLTKFQRPKNYNGYVVSNYKREGLKKNSASTAYNSKAYLSNSSRTEGKLQGEISRLMSAYGLKDPASRFESRQIQPLKNIPGNEPFQGKSTMTIEVVTQPGQAQFYDVDSMSNWRVTGKPENSFRYKPVKSTGNFNCPSTFGIYADPVDCRKFYQCVWYVAFHHMCGRGTAWSQENRTCDWPKRTECLLTTEEDNMT